MYTIPFRIYIISRKFVVFVFFRYRTMNIYNVYNSCIMISLDNCNNVFSSGFTAIGQIVITAYCYKVFLTYRAFQNDSSDFKKNQIYCNIRLLRLG